MTEKLPEWPEKPHGVYGTSHDWLNYHALVSYAALARMEALVEVVRELRQVARGERDYEVELDRDVNALLAACARKEAGK